MDRIIYILAEKILHCRGIEPRSPAWQARILPLNQQCSGDSIRPVQVNTSIFQEDVEFMQKTDHDGDRTHNLPIRSRTPYPLGHTAIRWYAMTLGKNHGYDTEQGRESARQCILP